MKSSLAIAGLLIGSIVGFLLRPSVPILGQLPFKTVITRGANLQGLDQLLTGYARTSFNYLIAGMVVGGRCWTNCSLDRLESKVSPALSVLTHSVYDAFRRRSAYQRRA